MKVDEVAWICAYVPILTFKFVLLVRSVSEPFFGSWLVAEATA